MNMNIKDEFKMAAPWVTYFEKIKALFEQDPEVEVRLIEEDGDYKIKIYVESEYKAYAISKLLPSEVIFGNVVVPIVVYPSNEEEDDWIGYFIDAFSGNPIVKDIVYGVGPTKDMNYVVFKKEVVQYYNDNMQSINGFSSTLYEDIARDIFKGAPTGTFFCTVK